MGGTWSEELGGGEPGHVGEDFGEKRVAGAGDVAVGEPANRLDGDLVEGRSGPEASCLFEAP